MFVFIQTEHQQKEEEIDTVYLPLLLKAEQALLVSRERELNLNQLIDTYRGQAPDLTSLPKFRQSLAGVDDQGKVENVNEELEILKDGHLR